MSILRMKTSKQTPRWYSVSLIGDTVHDTHKYMIYGLKCVPIRFVLYILRIKYIIRWNKIYACVHGMMD